MLLVLRRSKGSVLIENDRKERKMERKECGKCYEIFWAEDNEPLCPDCQDEEDLLSCPSFLPAMSKIIKGLEETKMDFNKVKRGGLMGKKKGIVVRMYSINQERLDEALQASIDFILEVTSEEKLAEFKKQLDARLKTEK